MKTVYRVSTWIILGCVALGLLSRPVESQDDPNLSDHSTELRELLVQRRDTLARLVDAVTAQYQAGTATINQVTEAQHDMLDAELALAKGKSQRLDIYQKWLASARHLEKAIEQQYSVGAAQVDQVLSATASRLEAEIKLLQERIH